MPTIYEDTRQQRGKHGTKHAWFESHGVELVRKKLDFGDYATDGSNVCIDTKKGLQEIAANVGAEHERFVREIERAKREGYRIIFLIEESSFISKLSDVYLWTNGTCVRCAYHRNYQCDSVESKCIKFKRRPMTGSTLQRILESMQLSYDCRFELVDPGNSARRICDLLGVQYE